MLYNSLSPHQKQKLEHRSGHLGKQSRLHFWSVKSATWPIGRSYHVLCKAQRSCSALSNLYSPLLGRRDKWTQSGRCWGEFLRKRGSAALEHLSPPTRPWSGQACLTPSTCCPWKGPLHIPHPPFHQQIFHQGWRMADIRENYSVERYLLRNFEISKMSPPNRNSSSRVWLISSSTMLAALMLLLWIWKDWVCLQFSVINQQQHTHHVFNIRDPGSCARATIRFRSLVKGASLSVAPPPSNWKRAAGG